MLEKLGITKSVQTITGNNVRKNAVNFVSEILEVSVTLECKMSLSRILSKTRRLI